MAKPFSRKKAKEMFWAKVHIIPDETSCWEWQAGTNHFGYGRSWGQENYAHRQSWRYTYGRIPKRFRVLHQCDNPPCVRPDHLFLGTMWDNAHDCIRKGRFVRARHVKMTLEQIADARRRYKEGESQLSIGRSMGISQAHISKIVRGLHW